DRFVGLDQVTLRAQPFERAAQIGCGVLLGGRGPFLAQCSLHGSWAPTCLLAHLTMDGATSSPPPLAAELAFTRVRPLINWPKSDISDFGWRDREGAATRQSNSIHPLPIPPPQAGEGADRGCSALNGPHQG